MSSVHPGMSDEQLLRYSRHILLEELGIEGQEQLLAAHAVVVGAGGLGSPVALYLASAGVGHITLVDHDEVDATNLQRQIAHNLERVGQAKAVSAKAAMLAINPELRIDALNHATDYTYDNGMPAQLMADFVNRQLYSGFNGFFDKLYQVLLKKLRNLD